MNIFNFPSSKVDQLAYSYHEAAIAPPAVPLPLWEKPTLFLSTVVLGSPAQACEGVGICKVIPGAVPNLSRRNSRPNCKFAKSWWFRESKHGDLLLLISKKGICSRLFYQHFSGTHFSMEVPCPLPESLRRAMQWEKAALGAGAHAMFHYKDFVCIRFKA